MIVGPQLWGSWMLVSSVLFWALLIVAIVALIRYLTRGGGRQRGGYLGYPGAGPFPPGPFPPPGMVTPEHILAERFARGEIDEQEFRQRMAVLRGAGPPPGTSPPPAGGPPPAPGASSSPQGPPPAP